MHICESYVGSAPRSQAAQQHITSLKIFSNLHSHAHVMLLDAGGWGKALCYIRRTKHLVRLCVLDKYVSEHEHTVACTL